MRRQSITGSGGPSRCAPMASSAIRTRWNWSSTAAANRCPPNRICRMLRYVLLGLTLLAGNASAQQAATKPPSAPIQADPTKLIPMELTATGDHWTYEARDEITGKVTGTPTHLVTDVTPTD